MELCGVELLALDIPTHHNLLIVRLRSRFNLFQELVFLVLEDLFRVLAFLDQLALRQVYLRGFDEGKPSELRVL